MNSGNSENLLMGQPLRAGSQILGVTRVHRVPAAKSCQLLFVSRSEKNLPALLAAVGPGVLTVSDREKFLNDGGMIALFLEGTHVRFDINLRTATKASLSLNARLLNVARSVQR